MLTAAFLVIGAVALWLFRLRRRGPCPDPRRELVTVAIHLARATHQGTTPTVALAEAAPRTAGMVGAQLRAACDRIDRGQSFDSALRAWSLQAAAESALRGAPAREDVELLVVAARFAEGHGSGLPEVFEGVAAALVDRAELVDELGALTSQARASVAVLCGLPLLGLVLVASIEPTVPSTLLGTTAGLVCLVSAVGLDLAAVAVSRRLTRRAIR